MNRFRSLFTALLLMTVVAGAALAGERAIVPVAGSIAGALGSKFRTEMQMHNPGTGVMRGTITFLPGSGEPQSQSQPLATFAYEIGAHKTVRFADVIESLGATGLGSLDIVPTEGALPRVVVRAFDDQGNFGTRGLVVPVLKESEAAVLGYRFALVAPADFDAYRFNIGVRTLGAGPTVLRVTERDAAGATVGEPFTLTYEGETFRHKRAADLLGREVAAGHAFSFETISGSAFVYATTVDNHSNDGSLQLDRPVNKPPVINGQTVTTDKDQPVTVELTATDPDGDPIAWSIATAPSHGTLSELGIAETLTPSTSDASVVYTPASGYVGSDSFTIGVEDDVNGRAKATIVVTVAKGAGAAPVGVDDLYKVVEGDTLTIAAPGVLSNDSDPDGDPLTAQLESGPLSAASFSFNADGSFTYVPLSGFTGHDYFSYRASDGTNLSNLTNVRVETRTLNSPPNAVADVATTDEDTPLGINVITNDTDPEGDPLTVISLNTTGTLGTVTIGLGGVVNYDPTTSAVLQALGVGGSATDTFSYTIQDAGGDTDTATVTVTVTGVDDLPVAVNDTATRLEDSGATAILVLANDSDAEGDPITITGKTDGVGGVVVITGGGTGLTYQPNADFCGSDSFTYTLNGGSTATVIVNVLCVDDAPTLLLSSPSLTVLEDSGAFNGTIVSSASAGPPNEVAQNLTFIVTNDNNALFLVQPTIDLTNGLQFTPAANANGSALVSVTITDDGDLSNGGSNSFGPVTFTINVTPVNDAPSFTKGADQTVLEGSGAQSVIGWATALSKGPADESGQTLTFNVSNDNNALFTVQPSIDASGNLTYTPATDASGTTIVTVTLSDDGGTLNLGVDTSAAQNFNINVTDINDAPSFTGGADESVNEDSGTAGLHSVAGWATAISRGPSPFEDAQTLNFVIDTNDNPSLFSVAPAISPTGTLTYTLAANAFGTATITLHLHDDGGTANSGVDDSAPDTLVITVAPQNDPPTANDDFKTITEDDIGSSINVILNDDDAPDTGETLVLIAVQNPSANGGNVVLFSSSSAQYTPPPNFTGTDTFTYTINDGTPGSNATATVHVTMTPLNDPPVNTVPGAQTVDQLLTLTFPGNISIADVDAFTPQVTLGVDSGTLSLSGVAGLTFGSGDGTADASMQFTGTIAAINAALNGLVYDPVDTFSGPATLTITTNDLGQTPGPALQDSDSVTINVTAINDPPVNALPAAQSTNEETTLTLSTANTNLISISDPDAGTNTVQVALTATNGTMSLFGTTGLSFVFSDGNGTGAGTGTGDATMTFRGTIADINTALNGLQFIPTSNYAGAASIQIVTNDLGNTGTGGVQSDSDTLNITVNPVNDAPSGASNTINGNEDAAYLFTAADFGFTDPNDTPANLLQSVVITTLPASGTLTLSGSTFSAGTEITLADINAGNLQFLGATSASGTPYTSFTFQVRDDGGTANGGVDLDASPNTLTINLAPVNDAPAGTDNSISGTEDTQYTFTTADFGFSDPNDTPPNALLTVRITTLPGAGSLTLSGSGFAAGTSIAVGDITAGNLKFLGAAQGTGSPYTTFTFQVQDDGGTANGGVDLDPSANTMTINLTAVNDAPAGTNGSVTGTEETLYTLTAADFGFTDPNDTPANALQSVVITTLPGAGSLTLSGGGFAAGTEISLANITAGNLKFLGAVNASGSPYTTFTFQVRDDGGTAGGGVDLDASANTLTINLTAVNDAPAGTNNSVTGLEETQYTFTAANFGFTDPNDTPANALASVVITTLPGSGSLTLSGSGFAAGTEISLANITAGNLKFLGATNGSGSPYSSFTFQVRDDGGTASGGVDLDPTPNTLTINLTGVNDAPAGTDNGVTGDEDVPYTFAAANFGFTDPNDSPANTLQSIVITTLPGAGILKLSGAGFAAGTEITLANIPNLTFTGASNAFGSPYSSFTFQVRDNGGTLNGGVDLDATPNTMTINLNPVNDAPTVKNENGLAGQDPAWQTIGNTELRVDVVAGTTPNVSDTTAGATAYEGLIDNDSDVEGDPIAITAIGGGCGDATAPFDCTLASGAFVHVDANGEFSFTPGPADTTDTFTYTVTDTPAFGSPASTVGTVVINMSQMVWYVDPNFGGGGGTSIAPFSNLDPLDGVGGAGDSDVAGDYIFVHDGSLSRATPMEMEANQHLVGEGFGLSIPVNLNGNGSPWVGVAPGTAPQITATAGDTVTVNISIPVEIVGLSLASSAGNAIDLTAAGPLTGSATLTIGTNEIRGAGLEGIDVNLNAGTNGTLLLNVTNNSWNVAGTHTGNAFDARTLSATANLRLNLSNNTNVLSNAGAGVFVDGSGGGSVIVTGFSSNTIHPNTAGTGISVNTARFDADAVAAGYQQVSGGTTVIGTSGNAVGAAGMTLTNVTGDLAFTDLDIFAGTSAFTLTGTGAANIAAGTGTQVTVGAGVGTFDAAGAAAVDVNNATVDLRLVSMTVTSTATRAVSLVSVSDSTTTAARFSAPAGSTITTTAGATGPIFNVSGGNAGISYAGTMNNSGTGRTVLVDSLAMDDATDDVSFSGAITSGGTGILVNNNSGAARSITFSGGLTITTTTGEGFAATTNSNSGGLNVTGTNTISSTSATALRVTNTTIGSSHLNFRTISSGNNTAAADPADGIVLNNTGATGHLAVTGDGTVSLGGNSSGGVIQHTTNHGVSLTSTLSPSFADMTIHDIARNGINGTSVTNFTFINGQITNTGTGVVDQYNESAFAFVDSAFTATTVSGNVDISNCLISGARRNAIMIETWNGTISNLNISNNVLSGPSLAGAVKDATLATTADVQDAIHVFSQGGAAQTAHITTGTINNNTISGFEFFSSPIFIGGNGIRVAGGSGNAGNATTSTLGTVPNPIEISGNDVDDVGSNAIAVSFNGQQGLSNFNIHNNGTGGDPMSNAEGLGISVFFGGSGTFSALVNNNVVDNNGPTVNAGSAGIGVQLDDGPAASGTANGAATIHVNNNLVTNPDGFGIRGIVRASLGTLNLYVQNNDVGTPSAANRNAIRVDSGSAVGDTTLNLNMSGNSGPTGSTTDNLVGSGVNAGIAVRKQGVVLGTNEFNIQGIAAGPTNAQVQAYIGSPVPPGKNYSADGSGGSVNGVDISSGSNYGTTNAVP